MGLCHTFVFEGREVAVRLPTIQEANRGDGFDRVAWKSSEHASDGQPISFVIEKVDVEVVINDELDVPHEAMTAENVNHPAYTAEQSARMKEVSDQHYAVSLRAFQHWLEVLRWASGQARIGQPSVSSIRSGWGTYLHEKNTGHRVWGNGETFYATLRSELTRPQWEAASTQLFKGEKLPMHLRFLHDAESSLMNAYFEKAILELALACEIYVRYAVFEHIPIGTPKEIVTYIEEANINRYISKLFRSLVQSKDESTYANLKEDLSSLISRRNSYVHMGKMDDPTADRCRRYVKAVKSLFQIKL
jgi:hypothetical protein